MYIFQIFDYYAASRTLLFVGLFECIAISYFYGVNKYCKNLEQMWRFKLGPWLRIMWVFATPCDGCPLAGCWFESTTWHRRGFFEKVCTPHWATTCFAQRPYKVLQHRWVVLQSVSGTLAV